MLRLCSDSSRSYPGRSVRLAVASCGSALYGNMQGDRAEVSPADGGIDDGHSRCRTSPPSGVVAGNEPQPAQRAEDIVEVSSH